MLHHGMNMDVDGLLFGSFKLNAHTWVITNRWQNFMYLLLGMEKALLIDTGYGEGNLRAYVEQITQKPIMVVNTHGHFDHTGGNGWWEDAWMTADAAALARTPFNRQQQEWFASKPYRDYKVHPLADGDRIDLGGRIVEVLAIPAHEASSIALLDPTCRLLFTGDELESGQVLLFGHPLREVVSRHKSNMEKLRARRADYAFLCPAHNGLMLEPDTYLEDFIALDQEILSGTALRMPDTGGFGFPPDTLATNGAFANFQNLERVQHGCASIVYMKEE